MLGKKYLKKQTVADLLLETLGQDELPLTNWNEAHPEIHF